MKVITGTERLPAERRAKIEAKRQNRARLAEIEDELRRAQPETVKGLARRLLRVELYLGIHVEVEG